VHATLSIGGHPTKEAMKHYSKLVTVLLLLAGGSRAMTDPAAVSWRASRAPAACHQHSHGEKGKPSTPTNSLCCVAGHGSALVRASFVPQQCVLAVQAISLVNIKPEGLMPVNPVILTPTSGAPPGASPLRV
jgi:hypothetical protein